MTGVAKERWGFLGRSLDRCDHGVYRFQLLTPAGLPVPVVCWMTVGDFWGRS